MSIRAAVSGIGLAPSRHMHLRRLLSTSVIARSQPSGSSSSSSAFADLAHITSNPLASSSTVSTTHSTFLPPAATTVPAVARGYAPGALAPKVDPVLDLLTNLLMKHGKKAEAQTRVATVLSLLQRATNSAPLPLVHRAVQLSSPSVRMLSMRKAAKTVQTPRGLNERQRARQGIVWLLKAAERGRKSGIRREDRIAREVLAVLEGTSDVFKRIEEVHRQATMNRSNLYSR